MTIKDNAPLKMLADLIGTPKNVLIQQLAYFLLDKDLASTDEAGQSLFDIALMQHMSCAELVEEIFTPEQLALYDLREKNGLLPDIYVWGTATENPCPECGSELEIVDEAAFGREWVEAKCSHFNCEYGYSTEPDYEIELGGRKYGME